MVDRLVAVVMGRAVEVQEMEEAIARATPNGMIPPTHLPITTVAK